jgi:hypothetical protein
MYIGTTIHENIAAYYRLRHDIPVLEQVWTNTESIAQVQRDLKSEGLTTVRIPTEFANGKPDILEYAPTIHPGLPVFGYEIKPLGKDGLGWMQAVREWDWYSEGLIRAGVPVQPGPITMYGTAPGPVQAPNGWAFFSSVAPGTITYKVLRAPLVAIKARDSAKNRKDSTQAPLQGLFDELLKSPSPVPSSDPKLLAFLSGMLLAQLLFSAGFAGALILL